MIFMVKKFSLKDIGPHCKVAQDNPSISIKKKTPSVLKSLIPKTSSPIHDKLCLALDLSAVTKEYVREHTGAIPGRKFRLDIAYPHIKLGIEVDGWSSHGKTKNGFQLDRDKQNLYLLAGWRILRYTASDIFKRRDASVAQIERAIRDLSAI